MFKDFDKFNLPELEEKVLKFWAENDVFNKSVALRQVRQAHRRQAQGKKPFRFFEGPPTANGRPAIHHALGRALKDIILRYKTMRGFYVPRKAGWDTHGLPVELEVEKELGIKTKPEIETYGIAPFNEKAKASVWKYKDEWEKLTARVGMWLDFANPYITYDNNYIESLWWVFSQIAKRKLLKKSHKVVPFCPRCQTALSSHELAQPGAYKLAKDPSVYIKFKLSAKRQAQSVKKGSPSTSSGHTSEFLLVWTTTPWTLPANVAVAVHPEIEYKKFKVGDEYYWSYRLPDGVNGEVVETALGKKLVGMEYEPLYDARSKKGSPSTSSGTKHFYRVLPAEFVSVEDGTGLVHIAPAFGEDDFRLIEKEWKLSHDELPLTIDDQGKVLKGLPGAGKFIKNADNNISADLAKRGLLLREGVIEHEYPFCWRCSTPLIYLARSSWFIEMSKLRIELLKQNETVNWVPENIKEGRFGEWLREVKDWAISRERYWGTPLPIWECEQCDEMHVVESFADLDKRAYAQNNFFAVRHGEATHNVEGWLASGPETKKKSVLTNKGIADAEVVAQKLKKEKIDVIIASPYYRIQQTAKIIAKTLGIKKIVTDKRLGELNTGVFNGAPVQEYKNFFERKPILEFTKTPEGGENLNDVRRRMFNTLRDINAQYEGKNILIVSHGDPLWVLEAAVRGLTNEQTLELDYIQSGDYRKLPLHNWPYNAESVLDVHRPYVDEVFLRCAKCDGRMKRVKEVADVWFDSGAMPFAQWHYPFENKKLIDSGAQYPADFISEGMDQTRGWFYTLLAVAVALGKEAPYKNVVSFGLLLDKNGVKMSKSKGNVVDPWQMFQKYGADVVRWHFYTVNPPGETKRFDEADLLKVYRRFFAIIYNSFIFLDTYGVRTSTLNPQPSNILDRWILAKLQQLTADVTAKMDAYNATDAGRAIEVFVDDLSRWYIRRSRRRFSAAAKGYGGQAKADCEQASAVLRHVLVELSKLIAPFTPFFAEGLYRTLNHESRIMNHGTDSVHLADYPVADKKLMDEGVVAAMDEVRRLASIGLAKRAEAGIKVRQPLATMRIKNQESRIMGNDDLLVILRDEVNVKEVVVDPKLKDDVELDTNITPELREEGLLRDLIRTVQELRQGANYKPGDKAKLFAELPEALRLAAEHNLALLKKETGLSSVEFKRTEKFDAEIATKVEGGSVWLGIKK